MVYDCFKEKVSKEENVAKSDKLASTSPKLDSELAVIGLDINAIG